MPLGGAQTAQYANFWNQGVAMPVSFEVDFAAPGGFSHYAWPMTTGSGAVNMYNNANWDFTTSGAGTAWGNFYAGMIYMPPGYFASTSNNDAIEFYNSTLRFDAFGAGSWTSVAGFAQIINNSAGGWVLRSGTSNNNIDYVLTAAQTTALEGRWIAVLISQYDTTSNYTSWTGGSGTGDFNTYHRWVFADVVTGELIGKYDVPLSYTSGSGGVEPSQTAFVGRSDYVTNGPVAGVAGIDIKFLDRFNQPDVDLKSINWWYNMGGTQDPLGVYEAYCQQGTWDSGESPYVYFPMRNSGDWINATTFYRLAPSADSRFFASGANQPFETTTATPTPTLVYV